MVPRGTIVALGLALAGSSAGADTVPGAATEIVRVDAVVTDANGALVRGLTRGDFELRDDGKVQRLTHFVAVAKGAAAPGPLEPGEAGEAPPGERAPGRQIVILVDDLHVAAGSLPYVKEALHRMLAELLLPSDGVALITTGSPGGVQKLTQGRDGVEAAIDALSVRQAGIAPARGSQMTPEQAELILRGDRNALLLGGRMILDEPGTIYDGFGGPRAAAASLPGANPGGVGEDSKERAASMEAQQQAKAILAESLRFSSASLVRIDDVLRGLSALPGRKLCLLVSEGFLVGAGTSEELTRQMRGVADAATRSGAVVYALDPRGVVTGATDSSVGRVSGTSPDLQSSVSRQSQELLRSTLETVSGDTGGFLVRASNDLAGGLRRMLDDNDAYYLMAYEPTATKRDGRFRKIELRLPGRRELVIRTRKGYYAPDDRKPASNASRGPTDAEIRAVLAQPLADSAALRVSADFVALPPAGTQAVVRAHVVVAGLAWKKADGRLHAALDVVGGAYDAEGNPAGAFFGGRRELDMGKAEYDRARTEGVDFQHQVSLKAGRYQIRVVARDLDGKTVGGGTQWVEIPNLEDGRLALSGVFLSTSPAIGPDAPSDSQRRFKRSDQLYFQFYVYNPAVDADGGSDALIQAQIWAQKKVAAASKPQPATLLVRGGVPVPQGNGMSLDSLEPGAYELRIVVVDRKANVTANRAVEFTVN